MIGLVACGKSKLTRPSRAELMYIGPYFTLARRLVTRHCATWRILSAKYGVLNPHRIITPYNVTLSDYDAPRRRLWSQRVHAALLEEFGDGAKYMAVAGALYTDALCGFDVHAPVAGMPMGIGMQKMIALLRAPAGRKGAS